MRSRCDCLTNATTQSSSTRRLLYYSTVDHTNCRCSWVGKQYKPTWLQRGCHWPTERVYNTALCIPIWRPRIMRKTILYAMKTLILRPNFLTITKELVETVYAIEFVQQPLLESVWSHQSYIRISYSLQIAESAAKIIHAFMVESFSVNAR